MPRIATLLLATTSVLWAAAAAHAQTALGVSPGGHYITYRGVPLVLVGDSGTQCVLQNANLDYRHWIRDCAAAGLNCVHLWSFLAPRQKLDGSDVESRYGYVYPGMTPWARRTSGPRAHDGGFQWDLQVWDEGDTPDHYWPRLRDVCRLAHQHRLLLGITVFWGWPKHPADWAYHPMNVANGGPIQDSPRPYVTRIQKLAAPGEEVLRQPWSESWPSARKSQWLWERFAEKLIRETAPWDNVFFVFMDEHSYSEGNGGDHFLKFFKDRGCRWVDWNRRRKDVDFVYEQVPHDSLLGKNQGALAMFRAQPARPFLILEGGPYQGEAVRLTAWSALLGGASYVFHDDAEQETVHTGIMGYDPKVPGQDTGAQRRAWLGHAARFFQAVQSLDAMKPMNELTSPRTFCLANPGREYAAYATRESQRDVRLDLSAARGSFVCRFYDPRTGQWKAVETRDAGHETHFTKPTDDDWGLLVQAESLIRPPATVQPR